MSGSKYSPDEIKKIHEMYLDGLTDKQIADMLGKTNVSAARSVFAIRRRNSWLKLGQEKRDLNKIPLEEMSKNERVVYLKERFKTSPRCKHLLALLNQDELDVFQDEYFKLLTEVEDLTGVEEQSLFLSIFEFVLAFQAQKNKADEDSLVRKSRAGQIKKTDPEFRLQTSERWNKEYTDHMKTYRDLITHLKLSREQRLKDEIKSKKSFLDYALMYAEREHQMSAATEILDLEKKTDDELKRLLKNGWIFGDFGQ